MARGRWPGGERRREGKTHHDLVADERLDDGQQLVDGTEYVAQGAHQAEQGLLDGAFDEFQRRKRRAKRAQRAVQCGEQRAELAGLDQRFERVGRHQDWRELLEHILGSVHRSRDLGEVRQRGLHLGDALLNQRDLLPHHLDHGRRESIGARHLQHVVAVEQCGGQGLQGVEHRVEHRLQLHRVGEQRVRRRAQRGGYRGGRSHHGLCLCFQGRGVGIKHRELLDHGVECGLDGLLDGGLGGVLDQPDDHIVNLVELPQVVEQRFAFLQCFGHEAGHLVEAGRARNLFDQLAQRDATKQQRREAAEEVGGLELPRSHLREVTRHRPLLARQAGGRQAGLHEAAGAVAAAREVERLPASFELGIDLAIAEACLHGKEALFIVQHVVARAAGERADGGQAHLGLDDARADQGALDVAEQAFGLTAEDDALNFIGGVAWLGRWRECHLLALQGGGAPGLMCRGEPVLLRELEVGQAIAHGRVGQRVVDEDGRQIKADLVAVKVGGFVLKPERLLPAALGDGRPEHRLPLAVDLGVDGVGNVGCDLGEQAHHGEGEGAVVVLPLAADHLEQLGLGELAHRLAHDEVHPLQHIGRVARLALQEEALADLHERHAVTEGQAVALVDDAHIVVARLRCVVHPLLDRQAVGHFPVAPCIKPAAHAGEHQALAVDGLMAPTVQREVARQVHDVVAVAVVQSLAKELELVGDGILGVGPQWVGRCVPVVGEDRVVRLRPTACPDGAYGFIKCLVNAAGSLGLFSHAREPQAGVAGGHGRRGQRVVRKARFAVGRELQAERQLHCGLVQGRLLGPRHGDVLEEGRLGRNDGRQRIAECEGRRGGGQRLHVACRGGRAFQRGIRLWEGQVTTTHQHHAGLGPKTARELLIALRVGQHGGFVAHAQQFVGRVHVGLARLAIRGDFGPVQRWLIARIGGHVEVERAAGIQNARERVGDRPAVGGAQFVFIKAEDQAARIGDARTNRRWRQGLQRCGRGGRRWLPR